MLLKNKTKSGCIILCILFNWMVISCNSEKKPDNINIPAALSSYIQKIKVDSINEEKVNFSLKKLIRKPIK
jgi:hypothetical protein